MSSLETVDSAIQAPREYSIVQKNKVRYSRTGTAEKSYQPAKRARGA